MLSTLPSPKLDTLGVIHRSGRLDWCLVWLNTYYVFGETAMHRKLTITLEEAVYEGLYRTVGKSRISQFIEDLVRPHVVDTTLDAGYRAMAEDTGREAEAQEWCNALAGDAADETR